MVLWRARVPAAPREPDRDHPALRTHCRRRDARARRLRRAAATGHRRVDRRRVGVSGRHGAPLRDSHDALSARALVGRLHPHLLSLGARRIHLLGFYHRRFAPAASSSLHPVRARVLQSVAGLSIVIGVAAFVSYQIAPTLLARVLGARPAEYAVRIERLVFRQGHRIRLEVASSNFPRYDRNLNTGAPIATATVTAVARQAVHHRPGALSRIVLPVVPSGSSRLNRDEPRESGSLHIAHGELVEP